jgi:hypothetical protein
MVGSLWVTDAKPEAHPALARTPRPRGQRTAARSPFWSRPTIICSRCAVMSSATRYVPVPCAGAEASARPASGDASTPAAWNSCRIGRSPAPTTGGPACGRWSRPRRVILRLCSAGRLNPFAADVTGPGRWGGSRTEAAEPRRFAPPPDPQAGPVATVSQWAYAGWGWGQSLPGGIPL